LIKLKAKPTDIITIQVYFQTDTEEMYVGLEDFCNLATRGDSLIIMRNWNTVGEGADVQVETYGLDFRNKKEDRFVDFCKQYMVIANTYQNIHRRKRYM